MRCHVCNVAVGEGQRFCHECGESLRGVTDPTLPLDAIDPDDEGTSTVGDESTDDDDVVDPAPGEATSDGAAPSPEPGEATSDGADPSPEPGAIDRRSTIVARDDLIALATGPATLPPGHAAARPTTDTGTDTGTGTGTDVTSPATGAAATGQMSRTGDDDTTSQMPAAVFDGAHEVGQHAPPAREGFRLRASFVLALLALVASVMLIAADVFDIRTSRPVDGISVGLRSIDDIGSNLALAGVVGTTLMLAGGLASCFGFRWGAGIAGGSGLATFGWAAVALGLAEVPIDGARRITRTAGIDVSGFTLSITRDIGWFLVAGIGVVGVVVFLASLRMAGTGGRGGLNPWIAAIGALSTALVAAGPLIPLGGAPVDVNLGTGVLPREFFVARLVQLGAIAMAGIAGFLSVRTYGLGLAAGGLGIALWLWATTFARAGDVPVGIGVGNIGTSDTMPHAVTTVGLVASLAMLAVATTMAVLGHRRRP
ncbi:hypothetical protein [Ilumatobacter sp.]|uniref:hypothetical protein n=1 Tax=Ilumatobacter sp. TaxID=1967498 RepID=UPI003B52C806